ncbi:hypothetical protein [Geminicoccus roseus]|uniref:hypothetical protein n=1 Tax=Geminicoccus roseus TaxID=404900 RepID=UPI00048670FF|nr:hypothetical protein [Geminicoccus roseus]
MKQNAVLELGFEAAGSAVCGPCQARHERSQEASSQHSMHTRPFSGSRESHVRFLMSHWIGGKLVFPAVGNDKKTSLHSTTIREMDEFSFMSGCDNRNAVPAL